MRARPLVAVGTLLVAACTGDSSHVSSCESLKDALDRCAGTPIARLDCGTVSDADLDRLKDLTTGDACAVAANAVPIDGDLESATCRVLGVGCAPAAVRAEASPVLRYPLVLVNGFDSSPLFRYEDRILAELRARGHDVHLATLTPYDAPRRRARELWARIQEITETTGKAKVNLVCHSLGGLDCRYLVSPSGLALDVDDASIASHVASITTVGTAHRGTRVADQVLGLLPDGDRGKMLNDFATLVGDWFSPSALAGDVHLRDALTALSVAEAAAFDASTPDADGVYVQSWAGVSYPFGDATASDDADARAACAPMKDTNPFASLTGHDYLALPLAPFVASASTTPDRAPNDGFVAVASAAWANFRGCIPADHMEQLGQKNLPDVNVRTGFDVTVFYAYVAGDLAARGF
jgi:triacylglycerol lipase